MDYIETIATYLYKKYEEAYDTIPADFDFINNLYAIELKIAESVTDNYYNDTISLRVRVVGVVDNKYSIISKEGYLNSDVAELRKVSFIEDGSNVS